MSLSQRFQLCAQVRRRLAAADPSMQKVTLSLSPFGVFISFIASLGETLREPVSVVNRQN